MDLRIAIETSAAFSKLYPTRPLVSPTTTKALKESFLPPLVTLVIRLMEMTSSTGSESADFSKATFAFLPKRFSSPPVFFLRTGSGGGSSTTGILLILASAVSAGSLICSFFSSISPLSTLKTPIHLYARLRQKPSRNRGTDNRRGQSKFSLSLFSGPGRRRSPPNERRRPHSRRS